MSNETIQKTQELLKRILFPTWEANEELQELKNKKNNKVPFVFYAKDFPVGMEENEALEKENSIFINYSETFKRLDYKRDGKLTKEELLNTAKEDKSNGRKCAISSGIFALLCATFLSKIKKDSIAVFMKPLKYSVIGLGAFFTAAAAYGIATMLKANQVIKQYND